MYDTAAVIWTGVHEKGHGILHASCCCTAVNICGTKYKEGMVDVYDGKKRGIHSQVRRTNEWTCQSCCFNILLYQLYCLSTRRPSNDTATAVTYNNFLCLHLSAVCSVNVYRRGFDNLGRMYSNPKHMYCYHCCCVPVCVVRIVVSFHESKFLYGMMVTKAGVSSGLIWFDLIWSTLIWSTLMWSTLIWSTPILHISKSAVLWARVHNAFIYNTQSLHM